MEDELTFAKPDAKEKKRKRLSSASDKHRQMLALYKLLKVAYIVGLANGQDYEEPVCERCEKKPGIELHHKRGREGQNLVNPSGFALLCTSCHVWVHAHSDLAREQGWLESRH